MVHIWLRAEQRRDEARAPITPRAAEILLKSGFRISVEACANRVFPTQDYKSAGCDITPKGSWRTAPKDAYILGLKELETHTGPLSHHHIYFGHAFKGQTEAKHLLDRFSKGDGVLLDLEQLTDNTGRRVAAFGYWAGFAGAAMGVLTWISVQRGRPKYLSGLTLFKDQSALVAALHTAIKPLQARPSIIVIGALGRVGTGACDLADHMGLGVTKWDMAETAKGAPFPEILKHDIFINCILAGKDTPRFLTHDQLHKTQRLSVIADIACDPNNPKNPIPLYHHPTSLCAPVIQIKNAPTDLRVMAVDNLPALLPSESSQDFAQQLLPHLLDLRDPNAPVWQKAMAVFRTHT